MTREEKEFALIRYCHIRDGGCNGCLLEHITSCEFESKSDKAIDYLYDCITRNEPVPETSAQDIAPNPTIKKPEEEKCMTDSPKLKYIDAMITDALETNFEGDDRAAFFECILVAVRAIIGMKGE